MSWVDFGGGPSRRFGSIEPVRKTSRKEILAAALNRKSTTVQDRQVLQLLRKGLSRKAVADQLLLTYGQVSGAVYRYESKTGRKSNL